MHMYANRNSLITVITYCVHSTWKSKTPSDRFAIIVGIRVNSSRFQRIQTEPSHDETTVRPWPIWQRLINDNTPAITPGTTHGRCRSINRFTLWFCKRPRHVVAGCVCVCVCLLIMSGHIDPELYTGIWACYDGTLSKTTRKSLKITFSLRRLQNVYHLLVYNDFCANYRKRANPVRVHDDNV